MNKYAIPVVIFIIVLFTLISILSQNRNQPADNTASPTTALNPSSSLSPSPSQNTTEAVVTFTGSGFSPATLTVPSGTTVQFKNDSSQSVWVASDPHPIHTDYPGFNAENSFNKGEVYSFTFTKRGSWGFHNHLNPSQRGTIIVQ